MARKEVTRRQFMAGAGAMGATTLFANELLPSQGLENHLCFLPRILGRADGNTLNFIVVMCDTWRFDHVGIFGNNWIQTPNVDAFAGQSQVFNRVYAGGFPTVLNRAELFTGRYMYTEMDWEDLPEGEIVTATVMNEAGYTTGAVFDNWHLKDEGFYFDRGFSSWEWIRGQERDRFRANPLHPTLPADPSKFRGGAEPVEQYLRNVSGRTGEADYLVAQTIQAAIEWLRRNTTYGPFYLHIDSFDPHEPWDPPQTYVDLYNPGYEGEEVIYPAYAPPDYLTPEELEHVRALYAGEITMVDHWFGILLAELDNLGLSHNTVVIFTSDHGFLLGEHNAVGKAWSHLGHYEAYPLYQELNHIPLMIRVPGLAPAQLEPLAQPADIMPTILDMAGASDPGTMHGYSLLPYMNGQSGSPRQIAVSSRSLVASLSSKPRATVTDGEWTLLDGSAHAPSELYYLLTDPLQLDNLIDSQCGIAQDLHNQLISHWQEIGVPSSIIDLWLPSPC
ncbi:MAG: sulfatase-like hydrolase/transferase [Candidatus Promineifilaceae bacterium]